MHALKRVQVKELAAYGQQATTAAVRALRSHFIKKLEALRGSAASQQPTVAVCASTPKIVTLIVCSQRTCRLTLLTDTSAISIFLK